MYNSSNYHISTHATFKACNVPNRTPDFISKSGSKYWYGQNKNGGYVIRQSDHWNRQYHNGRLSSIGCIKISTCLWDIIRATPSDTGKAYFKDFEPITHHRARVRGNKYKMLTNSYAHYPVRRSKATGNSRWQ